MKTIENWTTLELIEFLNSYNKTTQGRLPQIKEDELFKLVLDEFQKRQPKMAVLYFDMMKHK